MRLRKAYLAIVVVFAWLALALQFNLVVDRFTLAGLPFAEGVVRFASFFTVTTNTLAAVLLSFALIRRGEHSPSPPVMAAAAIYMVIVAIIYHLLLRKTWTPQGPQLVADIGLHYVMPAAMAVYWGVYVPKGETRWAHAVWWQIYPLAYFVFSLLEGLRVNWYPYPFIDVNALGYERVLINAVALIVFFIVMSGLMIALDRLLGRRRAVQAA